MLVLERLSWETGREYALRNLRENIIRLELEPGAMLSENELAAAMGISRTPVREALLELAKVNIVEVYPQRGSAISLIDEKQVEEAYFMREVLERAVVARCCKVATPEQIAALEEHIDLQRYYAGRETGHEAGLKLDNAFHAMLFEIAEKQSVFVMMSNMSIHLDRVRTLTFGDISRSAVAEEHGDIVAAIKARNTTLAKREMRKHIGRFRTVDKRLHKKYADYYQK